MLCCDNCDRLIYVGQESFSTDGPYTLLARKNFCSIKCLKNYIKTNILDEVIDEWIEENVVESEIIPSDPYAAYGVSSSDFI